MVRVVLVFPFTKMKVALKGVTTFYIIHSTLPTEDIFSVGRELDFEEMTCLFKLYCTFTSFF